MQRSFAVSLGALALAIVTFRGCLRGELMIEVIPAGIAAMLIFSVVGWLAGMVADYLVRLNLETDYRQRLADFREAVEASEGTSDDPATRGEARMP